MADPKLPSNRQLCGLLTFGAVFTAAAATVLAMWEGRPFSVAVQFGGLGAVAGLIAWLVYHAASGRRYDGLFFLVLPAFNVASTGADPFRTFAKNVVLMVPLALLAAGFARLTVRWSRKKREGGAGSG